MTKCLLWYIGQNPEWDITVAMKAALVFQIDSAQNYGNFHRAEHRKEKITVIFIEQNSIIKNKVKFAFK